MISQQPLLRSFGFPGQKLTNNLIEALGALAELRSLEFQLYGDEDSAQETLANLQMACPMLEGLTLGVHLNWSVSGVLEELLPFDHLKELSLHFTSTASFELNDISHCTDARGYLDELRKIFLNIRLRS